jgi:hypothetical protein
VIRFMLFALDEKPVVEGLPKEEANELESLMIQKLGTLELGGPLSNLAHRGRPQKDRRKSIDICFGAIKNK